MKTFRTALFGVLTAVTALSTAAWAGSHTVEESGKKFSAKKMEIKAGDTITFKNADKITHNIYSSSKGHEFTTKARKPGDEVTLTFDKEGKIKIRCALHPKMRMTVTVKK